MSSRMDMTEARSIKHHKLIDTGHFAYLSAPITISHKKLLNAVCFNALYLGMVTKASGQYLMIGCRQDDHSRYGGGITWHVQYNLYHRHLRESTKSNLPHRKPGTGSNAWGRPQTLQCLALSKVLGNKVSFPGSAAYTASLGSYFSQQEAAVRPHCIVSPQSARDVSKAVIVLTTVATNNHDGDDLIRPPTPGCQFALRSGGHASFAGAANIHGGVTIDLSGLNAITISSRDFVSVGAGTTWGEIYSQLDARELTVGGGAHPAWGSAVCLSVGAFRTWGPAWDGCVTPSAIINFEVVLANGSIVNANHHQHADLLWALSGGSNNFGIVTSVDLRMFEQGQLWGGFVDRPFSTMDDQVVALSDFSNPATYDDYASLLTTFAYSGKQDVKVIVNNMEYTRPVVNPPVYHALSELPSVQHAANNQHVKSDLAADTESRDIKGFRRSCRLTRFPTFPPTAARLTLMGWGSGSRQATATVTIQSCVEAINATVRVWNALGLANRGDKSLIMVMATATWSNAADDEAVNMAMKKLIATTEHNVGRMGKPDPFIYINYAAEWQNPIASYGPASVDELLETQRNYDPRRVFTRMVPGGFKLAHSVTR
ncbi:Bifunctional solanapyrone synthase [Metarhizium anisopliae]